MFAPLDVLPGEFVAQEWIQAFGYGQTAPRGAIYHSGRKECDAILNCDRLIDQGFEEAVDLVRFYRSREERWTEDEKMLLLWSQQVLLDRRTTICGGSTRLGSLTIALWSSLVNEKKKGYLILSRAWLHLGLHFSDSSTDYTHKVLSFHPQTLTISCIYRHKISGCLTVWLDEETRHWKFDLLAVSKAAVIGTWIGVFESDYWPSTNEITIHVWRVQFIG